MDIAGHFKRYMRYTPPPGKLTLAGVTRVSNHTPLASSSHGVGCPSTTIEPNQLNKEVEYNMLCNEKAKIN